MNSDETFMLIEKIRNLLRSKDEKEAEEVFEGLIRDYKIEER